MFTFPYTSEQVLYTCKQCNIIVGSKYDNNKGCFYPSSLYWNQSKSEVYCSAGCSVKGHSEGNVVT